MRCARCGYELFAATAASSGMPSVTHYYAYTDDGEIANSRLCCSTLGHLVRPEPGDVERAIRQLFEAIWAS